MRCPDVKERSRSNGDFSDYLWMMDEEQLKSFDQQVTQQPSLKLISKGVVVVKLL